MNELQIIDEHTIIRETVGYDFIKKIDVWDLPNVLKFLKTIWNYQKMAAANCIEIESNYAFENE